MKNILFAALDAYSKVGGIQQFNKRIVSALLEDENLNEISVVIKDDNYSDIQQKSNKISFITCDQSRVKLIVNTLKLAKSKDTLLLGHVNLLPLAFLSKIINPKIKVILFVHGIDVWGVNSRKIKKSDRFLIKFVDKIASVSAFTAQKMSESFNVNIENFTVFPNAVDPLKENSSNFDSTKKLLLLTVARLSENEKGKHHDSVLKALPKIIEKFPEVKYRIIGDGILKKDLEDLAQSLGVINSVEFKGRVSDEELAKSYQEASVFVMPSEKEGFGIVFLEAWLRKVPVICGTEDASHEVVNDGRDGFAIHHNDIDLLADKILFLLSNSSIAAEMGNQGNIKVIENYLMANFVANLSSLLKGKF